MVVNCMMDIACTLCLLDPCLFICRHMLVFEVEAVLLCAVGEDTLCGSAVIHWHEDSGRAVRLRRHANKPWVFQSDDRLDPLHVGIPV